MLPYHERVWLGLSWLIEHGLDLYMDGGRPLGDPAKGKETGVYLSVYGRIKGIDLSTLNLNDPYKCVVSQFYGGNYFDVAWQIGTPSYRISLGFDLDTSELEAQAIEDELPYDTVVMHEYAKLTNTWKSVIEEYLLDTTVMPKFGLPTYPIYNTMIVGEEAVWLLQHGTLQHPVDGIIATIKMPYSLGALYYCGSMDTPILTTTSIKILLNKMREYGTEWQWHAGDK